MGTGPTALSGTERILIVRTSAMGDIVHTLPVLSRLRAAYPAAKIGWVVERAFAPLLEGHPDLDEVITVSLRTWRHRIFSIQTWRQLAGFSAAIQRFSPDVVLDLMGTHKSGIISAWTLADSRFGLRRSDRREPSSSIWLSDTFPARGLHAVDRMLSVLEGAGIGTPAPVDFSGDLIPSRPWNRGPEAGEAFALLHPRTAWSNKNYPLESWSRVARLLKEQANLDSWIAWGPTEEDYAVAVAEASGARALEELADLQQLTALSRSASIVLGGDTGPVHLAHALGTPVVCIMGPTDPATNGPYGSPESAVIHRLPCSFCHRRLDEAKACLLSIPPTAVADRALASLARSS